MSGTEHFIFEEEHFMSGTKHIMFEKKTIHLCAPKWRFKGQIS